MVLSLIKGLIAEGWRVTLLTETNSHAAKEAKALGAEVITAAFMGSRTNPTLTQAVNQAVEKAKPNIVHLHGTRAAYFGRKLQHPAVINTIHGYHFIRKSIPHRLMGLWGAKQSFGAIKDLIFVSNYDRNTGESLNLIPPGAKVHVIHNGIELPVRPEVTPDPKLISFPHRLTFVKDPGTAISALQNLEGYEMEIAGTGEIEQAAKVHAAGLAVKFHGGLSREETLNLIARSGCMLMTSKWEGLPLVMLEAMALGTPVVAPAVCGIPEVIEDGVDGILVSIHSPIEYAKGIRRLEDQTLREQIVKNAKVKIQQGFTWRTCFAKHLELYESRLA